MIRLVALDPLDTALINGLKRVLYQSFGIGCEYFGEIPAPPQAVKKGQIDAQVLLSQASAISSLADDKVLFLTLSELKPREVPGATAPTSNFAQFNGARAVVTTHGLPTGDALLKRLAKEAVHAIGHLWGLHHCLDARCAMHPVWSTSFANGEPVLCTFCREKSEQRIRMAKT